ncbi:MAG: metallopeptidase family protein [bacterium]|nr:metallopeptidase family protein [bacterium]
MRGDLAAFERIVDDVLAELPEWVVERIDNLHVVVQDRPTPTQAEHGHRLLGLYEGVMLKDRGMSYYATSPDRISIFREEHLRFARSPAQLAIQIRKTVLHEMAHHLGIGDERLHELGWG